MYTREEVAEEGLLWGQVQYLCLSLSEHQWESSFLSLPTTRCYIIVVTFTWNEKKCSTWHLEGAGFPDPLPNASGFGNLANPEGALITNISDERYTLFFLEVHWNTLCSIRCTAARWDTQIVSLIPVRRLCTSSLKRYFLKLKMKMLTNRQKDLGRRYFWYATCQSCCKTTTMFNSEVTSSNAQGGSWQWSSCRALCPWPQQVGSQPFFQNCWLFLSDWMKFILDYVLKNLVGRWKL